MVCRYVIMCLCVVYFVFVVFDATAGIVCVCVCVLLCRYATHRDIRALGLDMFRQFLILQVCISSNLSHLL